MSARAEELFARWVEQLVVQGERLDPAAMCEDDPDVLQRLEECIAEYDALERTLGDEAMAPAATPRLPAFEGFRTIERLGGGGGGEVYKLEDLELGRVVAAKVLRPDNPLRVTSADFLDEARCLALFEDPRIVRILDINRTAERPFLLMEHVDGFTLSEIGPSLEFAQRARLMADVAEAIEHAHRLGVLHHDLKPANVLVDASLAPKVLDFGLARATGRAGRGVGTLAYMAPERLEPAGTVDARSDVYSLGVMLYELLCGVVPFVGSSDEEVIQAIRAAEPRLPVEADPAVPEALQAIALKAMERDPGDRYASARELARELERFGRGEPVLARPTLYQSALARRLQPHLEQIREWLRIKLIHPHEAQALHAAYDRLCARDDDWIVHGRSLSMSRVTLYLGAFLLVCGGLLYFVSYHLEAVHGLARPLLALGLPFAGLHTIAVLLLRRDRRAVAVAFFLAAAVLLPLLALIVLAEAGVWPPDPGDADQLLGDSWISNRQLQVAAVVALFWACWLALSTRTSALSTTATALAGVLHLTLLADFGLRGWLEEGTWDVLGLHLLPLLAVVTVAGGVLERRDRAFFARPLYLAGALLLVLILELVALDGRALARLGLSLTPLQGADVSDPLLLDTLATMTVNGLLVYVAAWLLDRHGTDLLEQPANLLFTISPFAILEPVFYLNAVGEYSRRFHWLYLGLALAITLASHLRQRRSFYYAGLVNTGAALWLITDRYEWLDEPAWAVTVVVVGLGALAVGYGLDSRERSRRE
jgi:serine/threonine protein kinase